MSHFNDTVSLTKYKDQQVSCAYDRLLKPINVVGYLDRSGLNNIWCFVKDSVTDKLFKISASDIHIYEDAIIAILFGGEYV
jgi:hypothetical protein